MKVFIQFYLHKREDMQILHSEIKGLLELCLFIFMYYLKKIKCFKVFLIWNHFERYRVKSTVEVKSIQSRTITSIQRSKRLKRYRCQLSEMLTWISIQNNPPMTDRSQPLVICDTSCRCNEEINDISG